MICILQVYFFAIRINFILLNKKEFQWNIPLKLFFRKKCKITNRFCVLLFYQYKILAQYKTCVRIREHTPKRYQNNPRKDH